MSIFPGYLTNGQFLRNMKPAKYLELLLVGHSLDDLYSEISTAYGQFLSGDKTIKFSTNGADNSHITETKELVRIELRRFNLQQRINETIELCPSPIVKHVLNENRTLILNKFHSNLELKFEETMISYANNEMAHISECLSGPNLFNLTDLPLDETLQNWINKGAKHNPYILKTKSRYLKQFDTTFIDCVNRIFKRLNFNKLIIHSTSTIKQNLGSFKMKRPDQTSLIDSLQTSYTSKRQHFKHKIHQLLHSKSPDHIIHEADLDDIFKLDDGRLIVETDKKLGFCIMNESDYCDAFLKVNADQHFEPADISEDWYIDNITKFITEAESALPNQLKNVLKPKDFKLDIQKPCLGTLRLLPKIQKLKTVGPSSIDVLKCRGIKSAMHDPIQIIQKLLDKIFSHLLYFIENQFITEFGQLSPSVSGVTEAIDRLNLTTPGPWGSSVQLDADFSNMYSNVDMDLLKRSVKVGALLAGLDDTTLDYINNLIYVNMQHSYFREPTGIFRTDSGFSMGDHSASRGSEVALRTSELISNRLLLQQNILHKNNHRFRFKDDITAQPEGTEDEILSAIEIIATSYPKEIQLNVEINMFQTKFLNLRIYNRVSSDKPYYTILRKRNSKYDIIPSHSNTCEVYKSCAGRTYFDMTRTHCSDRVEQRRQTEIVKHILVLKKYNKRQISAMQRDRVQHNRVEKLYIGKVEHDHVSKLHKFIRDIFRDSELDPDIYSLPIAVPGKKLLQYVFTMRKMRKQLNF